MKALKHLVFGKPGVTGMGKWKAHFLILIGLLLAKVVVDSLESLGRLMAIRGDDVPGFIAAAGGASELLFWPTAFLALHLLAAIIQINIAGVARGWPLRDNRPRRVRRRSLLRGSVRQSRMTG